METTSATDKQAAARKALHIKLDAMLTVIARELEEMKALEAQYRADHGAKEDDLTSSFCDLDDGIEHVACAIYVDEEDDECDNDDDNDDEDG